MKNAQNKEFEVEFIDLGQREDGALVVKSSKEKTLFFDIAISVLKIVPDDKKTDLEYLLKAQLIINKLRSIKAFEWAELEDDHFKILLQACDKFQVSIVSDGAVELMKYIKELKGQC